MPITKADAEAAISRVLSEDVLTLQEARIELFCTTGRRPDKATMTRWVHRGAGGVRLDAVRIGCQLLTSKQALTRFIAARTAKSIGNGVTVASRRT
jgi:hypothetical protein